MMVCESCDANQQVPGKLVLVLTSLCQLNIVPWQGLIVALDCK